MTTNTVAINQQRQRFAEDEQIWVFGYGSLIFKADFEFIERKPATIFHWARRFWQGSHDHRGTESNPGRVVTLIEEPGAKCQGMAYRISAAVLAHLDFREKNGYLRFITQMQFDGYKRGYPNSQAQGIVYIATPDNAAYLGPGSEEEIARHIQNSVGPSGANRDYALDLARALEGLNAVDAHVSEIAHHLKNRDDR